MKFFDKAFLSVIPRKINDKEFSQLNSNISDDFDLNVFLFAALIALAALKTTMRGFIEVIGHQEDFLV